MCAAAALKNNWDSTARVSDAAASGIFISLLKFISMLALFLLFTRHEWAAVTWPAGTGLRTESGGHSQRLGVRAR